MQSHTQTDLHLGSSNRSNVSRNDVACRSDLPHKISMFSFQTRQNSEKVILGTVLRKTEPQYRVRRVSKSLYGGEPFKQKGWHWLVKDTRNISIVLASWGFRLDLLQQYVKPWWINFFSYIIRIDPHISSLLYIFILSSSLVNKNSHICVYFMILLQQISTKDWQFYQITSTDHFVFYFHFLN